MTDKAGPRQALLSENTYFIVKAPSDVKRKRDIIESSLLEPPLESTKVTTSWSRMARDVGVGFGGFYEIGSDARGQFMHSGTIEY